MKDELHARYIENHCPQQLLTSIVCEEDADVKLILNQLVDVKKLNLNIIKADSEVRDYSANRICDIAGLKQYGITHWLDQVFDAPAVVKNAMNDNAQLFKVACGTNKTISCIDQLLNQTAANVVFTPERTYMTRRSRYDDATKSTRVLPLKKCRLFQGVDLTQKNKLIEELSHKNQEIKNHQSILNEYAAEEQQYQVQMEKVNSRRRELAMLKKKLEDRKRVIDTLKREEQALMREENVQQ